MRIVKFKDGNYGIRRGFLFYEYLDLKIPNYWWDIKNTNFKDCKGNMAEIERILNGINNYKELCIDKGTPI